MPQGSARVVTNIAKVLRELQSEADVIEEASTGMVKQATAHIIYELQDMPPAGTPRLTRRAVNGWNVSPGNIPDFRDPGYALLHDEPDPEREIAKLDGKEHSATIANGVPYIGSLEFGSSRQAPNNFVRIAIARGLSYLDFKTSLRSRMR